MSLPPKGSTVPLKKHLLQVWKATKKKPKELEDQPPLPYETAHLWSWYLELNTKETLTFSEIEAWSRLTCKTVTAQEAEALKRLDNIYWSIINERNRTPDHSSGQRRSNSRT